MAKIIDHPGEVTIGVIGANGVAATNRLCDIVERKVTKAGAFRDCHHPEMIVWQSTQVPSRAMYLEGRGPSFVEDYVKIASTLKQIGCDYGCICCNTAHLYMPEIQEKSGLPFINLLEEVAARLRQTGEKRFEFFVSDGALKWDIYGKAMKKIFPEAEIVYPDAERQRLVTKVITGDKTKNRFLSASDPESPLNILEQLVKTAAAPVVLGCTDLRVAYDNDMGKLPDGIILDSLETLADVIIDRTHTPSI